MGFGFGGFGADRRSRERGDGSDSGLESSEAIFKGGEGDDGRSKAQGTRGRRSGASKVGLVILNNGRREACIELGVQCGVRDKVPLDATVE
jgi:hypothetical protein